MDTIGSNQTTKKSRPPCGSRVSFEQLILKPTWKRTWKFAPNVIEGHFIMLLTKHGGLEFVR
jgi:hypothetical protein